MERSMFLVRRFVSAPMIPMMRIGTGTPDAATVAGHHPGATSL